MTLTRRAFLQSSVAAGATLPLVDLLAACARNPAPAVEAQPGTGATARVSGDAMTLDNGLVRATWSVADGVLRAVSFEDRVGGRTLALPPDVFTLALPDGTIASSRIRGDSMDAGGIDARPRASRLAERLRGTYVTARLTDVAGRVAATWRAELRDGSRYVRQIVTLEALNGPVPIREIALVDLPLAPAEVYGSVAGSPIVSGDLYLGFEHPLAQMTVDGGRARGVLTRELPLRQGANITYSSVIGATRPGQRRRDFLAYVERERAHPFRTFLHYNSWYDIGYFSKYDEAAALAVIDAFGRELHDARGVTLDSFLFDDGWDDDQTLWRFHKGFPVGFTNLTVEAKRYGAAPGVWLSPWGGYGKPRQERVAAGKAQGFETNEGGFMLSGPKYYERFRDACLDFIRTYGVNQFKIDGTGNASRAFPGSRFDSDFDAAIALIGTLRAEKPDLYVNLTTGTYPSPFWLWYADSTWRGGEDHDFAGVGSWRQKWITYRDADTYAGVVRKGPLYPLTALMLHGIIYARSAHNLDSDPQDDFRDEVRAYFGTGTQLQEMYVTPSLLTKQNWDDLAEAARWARRNAATLADTHWLGGDPAKLEPYGHAAWSTRGGVLSLRNPSDKAQTIDVDVGTAFELPEGAPRSYTARSAWRGDGVAPLALAAGTPHRFALRPFEVLTLDVAP